MQNLKAAVIGVGNMGSKYARLLQDGEIAGMELAALTRVRGSHREQLLPSITQGIPVFETADLLLEAVENGELALDAVIIATPHYFHEAQAIRAFRSGLHVLSDKPAGVRSAQSRRMNAAAAASGRMYGMVFHQRFLPIHQRLKEIVDSGIYGSLKRLNWTITDWYRPEKYYSSSSWHATWSTDGGGVILNQCPHNLDLICWICGTPIRTQAFCHEGRFHNIEVEDDVTAYFEWSNGATGTFISSTGDAPGVNRLEISLEEALLVCENGQLKIFELAPELGMPEAEYRRTSEDFFRKLRGVCRTETLPEQTNPYRQLLQNFADACCRGETLIAPGYDGHSSLVLSNAIYLSSWEHRMVELPEPGSEAETEFESAFTAQLIKKGGHL